MCLFGFFGQILFNLLPYAIEAICSQVFRSLTYLQEDCIWTSIFAFFDHIISLWIYDGLCIFVECINTKILFDPVYLLFLTTYFSLWIYDGLCHNSTKDSIGRNWFGSRTVSENKTKTKHFKKYHITYECFDETY